MSEQALAATGKQVALHTHTHTDSSEKKNINNMNIKK